MGSVITAAMDCRMADTDTFDSFQGEWTSRHQRAKMDYEGRWLEEYMCAKSANGIFK